MITWLIKKNYSIFSALIYFFIELIKNASSHYNQKVHAFWVFVLSKKTNNKNLVIFLKVLYYCFGVFAFVYLYVVLKQIHTELKFNIRMIKLFLVYKQANRIQTTKNYFTSILYLLMKFKKYNLFFNRQF